MSDIGARPEQGFPVDPGAADDLPGSLEGPDIEQAPEGAEGADFEAGRGEPERT